MEVALAEGDGLVVEIEIARHGCVGRERSILRAEKIRGSEKASG